jgi:hypothetical protein
MNIRNDNGEAAAAFYDKRRKWLDFVCGMSVSDRAFRVGYWLAKRMDGEKQYCYYGHKAISKALGISVDKVARAVAELEEHGVLVVAREHRKTNIYYIRLPFDFG